MGRCQLPLLLTESRVGRRSGHRPLHRGTLLPRLPRIHLQATQRQQSFQATVTPPRSREAPPIHHPDLLHHYPQCSVLPLL